MYDVIKNVINSKDYKLEDILYKINKMWIESAITEEEKTELDSLARQNAKAENSYAPLQEQIDKLYANMKELEARIGLLEQEEGQEVEEPETEEYPEYVAPSGAHDSYNTGDKITYNGKKYVCKIDGCVWSPDIYPAGWQEITTDNETVIKEE